MRSRIRPVMRRIMRWKVVFDVLTLIIVALIAASYWMPEHVQVNKQLVNYWFWILTIFVGAREAGRWIGDHESGQYLARFIAHGEIYLLMFLTLPFLMGVPESFLVGKTTLEQEAVMAMATGLALKVSLLYVTSAISKGASQHNKRLVRKLSSLVGIAIGGANENEGGNDTGP